jgi:cytochrome b
MKPQAATPSTTTVTVWSPYLRAMHWVLAASTIAAFATHEGGSIWHHWLGYLSLATAALRLVFGFTAQGYWRFDQCVLGARQTLAYVQALLARREARYLGHNPLGAWMVLALLINAIVCGLTGWLFTTDRFWGYAWLQTLHGVSGELFMPLLLLHLAGVAYTSWRHKESLVAAMMHGKKSQ